MRSCPETRAKGPVSSMVAKVWEELPSKRQRRAIASLIHSVTFCVCVIWALSGVNRQGGWRWRKWFSALPFLSSGWNNPSAPRHCLPPVLQGNTWSWRWETGFMGLALDKHNKVTWWIYSLIRLNLSIMAAATQFPFWKKPQMCGAIIVGPPAADLFLQSAGVAI